MSFGFFAVMAVLAWVFVYKMAPETKGRELEKNILVKRWLLGGKGDRRQQMMGLAASLMARRTTTSRPV